jgi:hypothetical protein
MSYANAQAVPRVMQSKLARSRNVVLAIAGEKLTGWQSHVRALK